MYIQQDTNTAYMCVALCAYQWLRLSCGYRIMGGAGQGYNGGPQIDTDVGFQV